MTTARLEVVSAALGLRNLVPRMPFRFGDVTVRFGVHATLTLDVRIGDSRVRGFAADFLSYRWFDRRPTRTPEDNVRDLILAIEQAALHVRTLGSAPLFDLWHAVDTWMADFGRRTDLTGLCASFGTSMVERAMLDALGRGSGAGIAELLRSGATGLDPGAVFPELRHSSPGEVVLARPLTRLAVRHTVGFLDPIDAADPLPVDAVSDGLPQTLEEYLRAHALRFLKIKLSGCPDADADRLFRIAALLQDLGMSPGITLDGNEQFDDAHGLAALFEILRAAPRTRYLVARIIYVEQPFDRETTLATPLDPALAEAIGKPVLIDEADGRTDAFRAAIDMGYRGVSHKNCKGVLRSVLNALLVRRFPERQLFMSAEDLTCLPVVSLHADLAVVAALGLTHAECNGYHYFNGLRHLTDREAAAALKAHPDVYLRRGDDAELRIRDGLLEIGSLQCAGMGFSVEPDMADHRQIDAWAFPHDLMATS